MSTAAAKSVNGLQKGDKVLLDPVGWPPQRERAVEGEIVGMPLAKPQAVDASEKHACTQVQVAISGHAKPMWCASSRIIEQVLG